MNKKHGKKAKKKYYNPSNLESENTSVTTALLDDSLNTSSLERSTIKQTNPPVKQLQPSHTYRSAIVLFLPKNNISRITDLFIG